MRPIRLVIVMIFMILSCTKGADENHMEKEFVSDVLPPSILLDSLPETLEFLRNFKIRIEDGSTTTCTVALNGKQLYSGTETTIDLALDPFEAERNDNTLVVTVSDEQNNTSSKKIHFEARPVLFQKDHGFTNMAILFTS